MTSPKIYLNKMMASVVATLILTLFLIAPLKDAFTANIFLNLVILSVLILGIFYVFQQVLKLRGEIAWLESYKRDESAASVADAPILLAPMASLLGDKRDKAKLSTLSMRSLLDSLGSRLDESRETSRYFIGLLVFLGLLGTFWGLLQTIGAIGDTIRSLSVGGNDLTVMFDDLKRGLQSPLSGMATAFSSSLFGLGGSVVVGFLDLQMGQAQNRFYNELEEWLSGESQLARASTISLDGEGAGSVPSYVAAVLEQSADSLDALQRVIGRSEDGRAESNAALMRLTEEMAALSDNMKMTQQLLSKMADGQSALTKAINAMANAPQADSGIDQASRDHLRNMDVHLTRLLADSATGRERMIDELRAELKLLSRTISTALDQQRRLGGGDGGRGMS